MCGLEIGRWVVGCGWRQVKWEGKIGLESRDILYDAPVRRAVLGLRVGSGATFVPSGLG